VINIFHWRVRPVVDCQDQQDYLSFALCLRKSRLTSTLPPPLAPETRLGLAIQGVQEPQSGNTSVLFQLHPFLYTPCRKSRSCLARKRPRPQRLCHFERWKIPHLAHKSCQNRVNVDKRPITTGRTVETSSRSSMHLRNPAGACRTRVPRTQAGRGMDWKVV
jgi:hypothetical protein